MGNDEANFVSKLWPFLTTAVGLALGLAAEPVKAWWLRKFELRLAHREVYTELAGYIAKIERVQRGLGHDEGLEDVEAADYESSKRICKTPPKFDVIQWYKSNRLDLLLRIDRNRGIRMLSEGIVALHEQAHDPVGLPARVLEVLRLHEKNLDGKLLRKYISDAHTENAVQDRKAGERRR